MPRKPKDPPKDCKRCGDPSAVPGEKYCKHCKKQVLLEMKEAGYLTEPHGIKTPSEQIGRKVIDAKTLGGMSELNHDGDDE